MQTVTVTVKPEDEPVTLAVARTHLRIDHTDENDLIQLWIKSAREYVETYTGRRFVTQTVRVKLDCWPSDSIIRLTQFGGGDVTSITSVKYLDGAGVEQTISAADYQYDLANNPPIICPAPLDVWPVLETGRLKPITIELIVGSHETEVPAAVKSAILLTLAYWDENRGGESGESEAARGLPAGALRLLDSAWTGAYV